MGKLAWPLHSKVLKGMGFAQICILQNGIGMEAAAPFHPGFIIERQTNFSLRHAFQYSYRGSLFFFFFAICCMRHV